MGKLFPSYLMIVFFLVVSLFLEYWHLSLGWSYSLILTLGLVGFYGIAAWYAILDVAERNFIRETTSTFIVHSVFRRFKAGS